MKQEIEHRTVTDLRTLKGMAKKGLIELHPQTGKKVTNPIHQKGVVAYYCYEVPAHFVYKDKHYGSYYASGCFMPYVQEIIYQEEN